MNTFTVYAYSLVNVNMHIHIQKELRSVVRSYRNCFYEIKPQN